MQVEQKLTMEIILQILLELNYSYPAAATRPVSETEALDRRVRGEEPVYADL